jgi:hypothetical protein
MTGRPPSRGPPSCCNRVPPRNIDVPPTRAKSRTVLVATIDRDHDGFFHLANFAGSLRVASDDQTAAAQTSHS